MNGEIIALAVVLVLGAMMWKQQRTIDRLTDKLMAGDYRIYKSLEVKEEDASPPREEDPKGWYDH